MLQEHLPHVQNWVEERVGTMALPWDPELLEIYALESLHQHGRKSTNGIMDNVFRLHNLFREDSPSADVYLSRLLGEIQKPTAYKIGVKRVVALRGPGLDRIERTAFIPRHIPGGTRMENETEAEIRGLEDIAMLRLQHSTLLRLGELLQVKIGDVRYDYDGDDGTLLLNSPASAVSRAVTRELFIPGDVLYAVAGLRPLNADPADLLFPLTLTEALHRIKEAGKIAELGEGLSGQSARIGMTQDLLLNRFDLKEVQRAGNWLEHPQMFIYCIKDMEDSEAVESFYENAETFPRPVV